MLRDGEISIAVMRLGLIAYNQCTTSHNPLPVRLSLHRKRKRKDVRNFVLNVLKEASKQGTRRGDWEADIGEDDEESRTRGGGRSRTQSVGGLSGWMQCGVNL